MAQAEHDLPAEGSRLTDNEDRGEATQRYDFRTGSELLSEALSQLRMNVERMCMALNSIINAYLDCPVRFEVESIEDARLNQFIVDLPEHSAMALIRLSPQVPPMVWAIEPELTGAISGRMLGGDPETIDRSVTVFEAALLRRFVQEMVDVWGTRWEGLGRYRPRVTEVVTHPAQLQRKSREGESVVVEIGTEVDGVSSSMYVALPVAAVQQIPTDTEEREEKREIDRDRLRQTGERIVVPVSVVLHRTQIRLSEAAKLREGDVLPLGKPVDDPVTVAVRGQPKFTATIGVAEGRLAAKLLGPANQGTA